MDRGESWRFANNGLAGTFVHVLTVSPQNTGTMYAGTYGDGVFKSIDAGENWEPVALESPVYHIDAVAIDPTERQSIYVLGDGILLKSADGGQHWNKLARIGAVTLAMDPINPKTLYAGGPGGRVYTSTDGGEKWRALCFLPEDSIAKPVLIDPESPSTLFVGTVYYGVYTVRTP